MLFYLKWIVLSTWGRNWHLNNRGLGIKAKKCVHEGVIVPTALYEAEAWGMRTAERKNVNVLEMKCLRSLVGVSRMDKLGMKSCVGELE